MKFEEILEKFRALGGVADNVELRIGQHGRGIFPIKSNLPIKIITPTHLLISPSWLKLDRENHIRINPKLVLDPDFVDFYETYQKHFGWSNGGLESLASYHSDLGKLSKNLKQYLLLFGWTKSDFDHKSTKNHLNDYFISRQIRIENESWLMPIVELSNHSSEGQQYLADKGISVAGTFKTEVLTCYHGSFDALHFYRNYHFPAASTTVLSCDVKIDIPKVGTINISRFDAVIDIKDGVITPKITKKSSEIRISFLELVNNKNTLSPRELFAERMQPFGLDVTNSNAIFDGLIEHNRKALTNLINECMVSDNKIAQDIKLIATSQLNLLE